MLSDIQKLSVSFKIPQRLQIFLDHCLQYACGEAPRLVTPDDLGFPSFARSQQRIRFQQVFYGRLSSQWATLADNLPRPASDSAYITGHQWLTKVIRVLSRYHLQLWELCCQHLHGTTEGDKRAFKRCQVIATTTALFKAAQDLPAFPCHYIQFITMPVDQQPTKVLQHWIRPHQQYIKV
jgi:hypothetical protein